MENFRMYLRLRHRVKVKPHQPLYLNHIAQYVLPPNYEAKLLETPIYTISPEDEKQVMIDILQVVRFIKKRVPELDVECLGESHIILEIDYPSSKPPTLIMVSFVWFILFFGSGLAIMHFHEDVNMLVAHQKIYYILTEKENAHPLLLQIPYSIGIGLGMIIFFNRLFKKKFNEEPSPLEVEMFNYQQELDQYIVMQKQDDDKDSKKK